MRKLNDLTGQKFGKLTVIKRTENRKKITCWLCKCDCGKQVEVIGANLTRGLTKSCGCSKTFDLVGQKFGKLTVLKKVGSNKKGVQWLCQCECGNTKIIRTDCLTRKVTQSCGECNNHYQSGTKLYGVWASIKARCLNPKDKAYKNYGGRGITICKEWLEFEPFYKWAMANGYKEGLSIDRINNNDNYSPENCRWVSMQTQANNTRKNRYITYKGETHTLSEWSRILGLSRALLSNRLNNYHWTVERAFTTPPIKYN